MDLYAGRDEWIGMHGEFMGERRRNGWIRRGLRMGLDMNVGE